MRIHILVVLILAFSSTSFAACYTVYDKSDKPVYKSSEPPFDLSIPISEGIKSKYPGGYLVQDSQKASCYLRNKSNESFRNRRIQLQSQGFSEVRNERVSILPFPKKVMVVDRPLNTPAFPVTQGGMVIGKSLINSLAPSAQGNIYTSNDEVNLTKNLLGKIENNNDNYQTNDLYGHMVNSKDSYLTSDSFGHIVNSKESYMTNDSFGHIVNSKDCYQTNDSFGHIVRSSGC